MHPIRRFFIAATALAVMSLGGCAQFQAVQPDAVRAAGYAVTPLPPSAAVFNHTTKPVDPDGSVVYTQYSGGSLAVGLLVPFGRFVNIEQISKATDADVGTLIGHVKLDAAALFAQAASTQGISIADGAATRAMPYLHLLKLSDVDTVLVSTVVLLEADKASPTWRGKYVYQLPGTYTLASLRSMDAAAIQALSLAAADGFTHLAKYMREETPEKQQRERKVLLSSPLLYPSAYTLEFYGTLIEDAGDVAWFRATDGVFALRKANLSYQLK